MQIGLLNHLSFPSTATPPASASVADDSANATATSDAAASVASASASGTNAAAAPNGASAILTLGSADATASTAGLVYSNTSAPAGSSVSDTDRMAAQYQQALARNNGVSTRLSVGKDGVLQASSSSSAPATTASKPEDFVTFAVKAMRANADALEQAQAQASATQASSAPGSLISRSLGDMQKLAARFNLFS